MKRNNTNKSGYILVFTLLIIAAATAIGMYIFNRGSVQIPLTKTAINREKAKMIALGGVQVAIAQLAYVEKKEKKVELPGQEQKKEDPLKEQKDFLKRILPRLNRWQTYNLDENIDGVRGILQVCLMSEEGKINLNEIFDFEKLQFKGEKNKDGGWKKQLQEILKKVEQRTKTTNLFTSFEKFIKARQYKINDVTELLTIKEFQAFKDSLYYEPPSEKERKGVERSVYLTDLFTTFSSKANIEPWLFSDSLLGIFGIPRAQVNDGVQREKSVEKWIKNFKKSSKWQQDWKQIMVPMYQKDLQSLPKNIDSIFTNTFDPKIFSVLIHATVDKVTQRIFAILERIKRSQNDQIVYDVRIRKFYWL